MTGIRTTLPFFRWWVAQPDFIEGRFHTTSVDDLLAARSGRSFVEAAPDVAAIAAIAVALQTALPPSAVASTRAAAPVDLRASRWKAQARVEALRAE